MWIGFASPAVNALATTNASEISIREDELLNGRCVKTGTRHIGKPERAETLAHTPSE